MRLDNISSVDDGRVSLQKTIPGVAEADDLTVRAANLLKAETGCESGCASR